MRWNSTPAAVVRADGDVRGVRGGVPLAEGQRRGHGRAVLQVVQDLRHHRRRHRRARPAGLHAARLCHQAQHMRHPRVGVGDVAAGGGGAGVRGGAGRPLRLLRLRLRDLPLLPRGHHLLCHHGLLHPVREQLLPDAEERRGHGGPQQVQLLGTSRSRLDSFSLLPPHSRNRLETMLFCFFTKILCAVQASRKGSTYSEKLSVD